VAGRPTAPVADADTVIAAARAGEPDRYLAALLAPRSARPGLLALAAFAAETARVPLLAAREPAIGEIRLQWWRDAIEAPNSAPRTGAPVADALRDAVADYRLPLPLLLEVIEARSFEVACAVMADDAALRGYLWQGEGALFALAAHILSRERVDGIEAAAAACGHAYGLARLLLDLPRALSHGHLLLPSTRLEATGVTREELLSGNRGPDIAGLLADLRAEARGSVAVGRQVVANLPRELRAAFLPLALVEPYLRTLERPGRDSLREEADIAPLTRVTRIAAAHWLGWL
jgi:phytoene synthase